MESQEEIEESSESSESSGYSDEQPEERQKPSQPGEKQKPSQLSLIFTAISPKVLLSQSIFNISVFVEERDKNKDQIKIPAEKLLQLHFSAKITREEETFSSVGEISLASGKSATLSIQIPELKSPDKSEYKLILAVRDDEKKPPIEEIFEDKIFRIIQKQNKKKFKVPLLAQTDKGVYKPGDTVKFRIVVLDPNFRPFTDSETKLSVKIFDPDQNLVKMWTEAQTNSGIFSSEFPLSTNPIYGTWEIKYEASVKTQTQIASPKNPNLNPTEQEHKENGSIYFPVEEYVLPKFKMSVKLLPYMTFGSEKISVRVEVKYTHGGGVRGQVKLTSSLNADLLNKNPNRYQNLNRNSNPNPNSDPTLENLSIDDSGVLQTEIGYKTLFGLGKFKDFNETTIFVHAEFTDGVNGKKTRVSSSVGVFESPYKIETWSKPWQLVQGLDFTLFVKVTMQDGSPIATGGTDKSRNVVQILHPFPAATLNHSDNRKQSAGTKSGKTSTNSRILTLKIDADGMAKTTFDSSATSRVSPHCSRFLVLFRDEIYDTSIQFDHTHSLYDLVVLVQDQEQEIPNSRTPIIKTTAANATFQISATVIYSKPFQSINYFVTGTETKNPDGMNKILVSGTKIFPKREKFHQFQVSCPNENPLSPSSVAEKQMSLFMFIFIEDKTMQAGSCDFVVKNLNPSPNPNPEPVKNFQKENFLEISLSEETREPAQNVTFKITTGKNSLVALKAVDESVLILNNNADIDSSAIARAKAELEKNEDQDEEKIPRQYDISPSLTLMDQEGIRVITNGPLREYIQVAYGPGAPAYLAPPARVRTEFPETWIWEESFSQNGTLDLSKIVPDSLTSWIITGFSISKELGIAALSTPKKLMVSREFFLVLNLPYSVIQAEILHLQVIVHNHNKQKKEIHAEITLENSEGQFEFQSESESSDAQEKSLDSKSMTKKITVKPDGTSFVTFPIKPMKFGAIDLNVTGSATPVLASNGPKSSNGSNRLKGSSGLNRSKLSDALSQKLRVVPPGEKETQSVAVLLTPSDKNIQLVPIFPEDSKRLDDSLKISAISDLLGATIDNMDSLIQMPYGCGEQNMLNFVIDIVVLEYLESYSSTSKKAPVLHSGVKEKAIKFLESGYQRQLTYRHKNGSFSCFGKSDETGSTWLTAFVLRSFLKASAFIKIDDQVMNQAAEFLSQQQDEKNGSFEETGTVHHSELVGNSGSKGVTLTAFCLLALLQVQIQDQAKDHQDSATKSIQRGIDFILQGTKDNNAGTEKDLYALILTTFVLHLADHEENDKYFEKMEKAAIKERDLVFWGFPDSDSDSSSSSDTEKPKAANSKIKPVWIEMTGYALLIHKLREDNLKSTDNLKTLLIVKWLLKHRNSKGGFISTQDTVVGLSAVAQFAKGTKSKDGAGVDLNIVAKHGKDGSDEVKIRVNEVNSILLQEFILPASTPYVSLTASGTGSALVQLSWYYFLQNPVKQPAFSLDVTALERPGSGITLKICISFLVAGKESESESKSNMAIVEVNFPSGFSVDKETLTSLQKLENYKRRETENQENRLNIYFESVSKTPTCFQVEAEQTFKIINPAKTYVSVYDYYEPKRRARTFYSLPKIVDTHKPTSKAKEESQEPNIPNLSPPTTTKNGQKKQSNQNKSTKFGHKNS